MAHVNIEHKDQIGQSRQHDSAILHATGRARYVDDIQEPKDCLHAYPVFAHISKGRIRSIDTLAAEQSEGFVRLIRLADVPGQTHFGPVRQDDPLLTESAVTYHHQPVMLVIANSHRHARIAASKVKLTYDREPPALDIEQSIQRCDWLHPPISFSRGDIHEGFEHSPHRLQGEFSLGGQEHFYLEGQVAMSIPTDDGGMFVYCSTQNPTEVQTMISLCLNQPMSKVTIETRRMGGGFGGKEIQAASWAVLAALGSYYTGKAVKLRLARSDDFRATGKRHPFLNRYDVGFNDEGSVISCDITLSGFGGCSSDLTDAIVDRAMLHADNAYFYENVRITGNRCRGDTVSNTAFRGFGGPQGMIVAEAIMDEIARYLNKDPLEVRKINLYKPGRDQTPYHQTIEQFILADMITQLAQTGQYAQRRAQIHHFNSQSPIIKRGLALTPVKFGISFTVPHMNQAGALIHLYTDGTVQLNHGGVEMGQGLNTKIAQIVAHAFGISLDKVAITATRTDKVPNTSPTAASSGTDLNGMAALNAANTLIDRLKDFLAERHHCESASIAFKDNQVTFADQSRPFADIVQQAYMARVPLSATGYYATPDIYFDRDNGRGHPFFYYSHGAALTEVEIDILTGENCVLATDILFDVGNSINPALDIGQIAGAFIQGMGWLTTEELQWNSEGELSSAGPATYKIPAIGDTPAHFNVALYDSANPALTVFHSKAIGEPPFMLANSVWCALTHAISSLAEYQYCASLCPPATAERILRCVQETQQWQAQTRGQHHEP